MAEEFTKSDLEILISTMNRNSLDFLIPMFPDRNFYEFNILIVNQTTRNQLLQSEFSNVRIINSFEKGLSKSRNLALKNARGKLLLLADDDVSYLANFDENIATVFKQNNQASIICFQTKTFQNRPYSNYAKNKFLMNIKQVFWVLSIEIAIKREDLIGKKIEFNEHFGLGAQFQDSESLFFLRRTIHNGLKVLFFPEYIAVHDEKSSSDDVKSDRWLYAKGASLYKRYQMASYLWLLKIVLFLWRKNIIKSKDIGAKFKVGLKGIKDYKSLLKRNLEYLHK